MKKTIALISLLISITYLIMSNSFYYAYFIEPNYNVVTDVKSEIDFSIYLTNDNNLYGSGANTYGQLGRGNSGNTKIIEPYNYIILDNVSNFVTGRSGFVLALTFDGLLYGFGNNEYGQIGGNLDSFKKDNSITIPTRIDFDKEIVSMSAGTRHSVILTSDGCVYTMGSNGFGQLGLGLEASRLKVVSTLTKINQSFFNNEKVVQVETSEYSTFCLTEFGNVYAFGDSYMGILVDGNLDLNRSEIAPIKTLLTNIKKISVKSNTGLALTNDNIVYSFGGNTFKQLGNPSIIESYQVTPTTISTFMDFTSVVEHGKIVDILSGGITNFLLDEDGNVYSFGLGGNGTVGFNIHEVKEKYNSPQIDTTLVTLPTKIVFYENIKITSEKYKESYFGKPPVDMSKEVETKITKLLYSNGERTFIKDDKDYVYGFGSNTDGLCSSGNLAETNVPIYVTLIRDMEYDQKIVKKNYMIEPIIGLSLIFGVGLFFITKTEINTYKMKKKEKKGERKK